MFNKLLDVYERWVRRALKRPALTLASAAGRVLRQLGHLSVSGPRLLSRKPTPGKFTINLKAPTGTRIEVTDQYVAKIEDLIRHDVLPPSDLKMIVSNIGVVNDFTSLYTSNSGMYTATIQAP
jgi:HAE1 family hydrophobic/amphiphilic exporter-1